MNVFRNKIVKNASWIIVCKIAEAILHMVITIITTRYLGPSKYGVISYAASIVAFVVPFMHLGIRNILVNELINLPEKKGEAIGSALLLNLISSVVCILGITSFVLIVNRNETDTIFICILYGISLLFQSVEIIKYWFQEQLISKYVSGSILVAYFLTSIYQIAVLLINHNVLLYVISEPIRHLLISILLLFQYKLHDGPKIKVSATRAKQLLIRGAPYIIANLMLTVYQQTDKIMLKQIVGDAEVGFYAAAVTCAGMVNFVYLSIIDSVRPVIYQKQKESIKKFEDLIRLSYGTIGWLSVLQCIAFTLFAPLIIKILFGSDYLPSVKLLQIVVWFTAFAHIGLVQDVWILSQEKQHYIWKLNLAGVIVNIILNLILIPLIGGTGAAIASVVARVTTNIIMFSAFKDLRRTNVLLLQGMNPKFLIRFGQKYFTQKENLGGSQ